MLDHLLFGILLWLPAASLLRFKAACKSWYNLIESWTFASRHFSDNSCEEKMIAQYSWSASDYRLCLLSGKRYDAVEDLDLMYDRYPFQEAKIIGSCKGLVCLESIRYGQLAICNPATKQTVLVPQSEFYTEFIFLHGFEDVASAIGFGFDQKSADFKIVRTMTSSAETGDGYLFEEYQSLKTVRDSLVEVYSLKTKQWRVVHENSTLPFKDIIVGPTASRNGLCHWIAQDDVLVSFDFTLETFSTTALPSDGLPNTSTSVLDFLEDNLAYIKVVGNAEWIDVWVLDKHAMWSKKFHVGLTNGYGCNFLPLGLSGNARFLLLKARKVDTHEPGRLHVYDLITPKQLGVGQPFRPFVRQLTHYSQSLIPITSEAAKGDADK